MNAHCAVFFPALGDKKLELGPEEFGTNTCKVKWHRSLQGICSAKFQNRLLEEVCGTFKLSFPI
jgi:hypothetical protein